MFPANDTFNFPVNAYTPVSWSAATIAQLPTGNFDHGDVQNAYRVNLVTNATPAFTIHTVSGGHNPAFYNASVVSILDPPFIEAVSDHHWIALNTDTCTDAEAYGATWTSPAGPFAAYSGQTNDLNATWASQAVANHDAVTASGLQYIGLTFWGEDASLSVINHMGSFAMKTGTCYSQYGYVYPATSPAFVADTLNCAHPIHNGSILVLQPSFDCTKYDAKGQAMCIAWKTYGQVLRDQAGGYTPTLGETTSGTKGWNYAADLQPFYKDATMSASNFYIVELGPLQCLAGHPGCK